MRVALFVCVLALIPVSAGAQDNPACAQFENPLAYNDCLAKLGPKAAATRGVAESPRAKSSARAYTGARGRNARVHMEFSVTPR